MDEQSNILKFPDRKAENEELKLRIAIMETAMIRANSLLCNFRHQEAHVEIQKGLSEMGRKAPLSSVPHTID